MMTRTSSVVTSAEATNTSKPVFMSSSFNKTTSDLRTSKLRSLLPKNLLNQTSKAHVQTDTLQELNDPEARSSLLTNSNTFQAGEIIMTQAGDEARPLHDGAMGSASETMENVLKVHFNGPSASNVLALTEAQVQKLLAMNPPGIVSSKPQVLHMVAIEEGSEPQPLSMSLEDSPLPVTLEDHPVSIVEDAASLEVNPLPVTPASSPLSVSVTPPVTNSDQATPKIHPVPVTKRPTSDSEPHMSHITSSNMIPNTIPLKPPTQNKDKEVVKKTMVEAFVKMVVCRKVTVQTVDQTSGQILDTKVKLEEEDPVILGVDCVETTEDLASLASSTSAQEEKSLPMKLGQSLDGGLKFLSAVSESRQKIGKTLLADALLKSSLKRSEHIKDKIVSEDPGIWKSVQVSDCDVREINVEMKVEENKFDRDVEWNEEDCNDESEDYVPGRDEQTKLSSKQRVSFSGRQPTRVHAKSSNVSEAKNDIEPKTYKKRGRKRRWDNALGIASKLKTCQFCNKTFKTSQACAKHMKKGKCVSSVFCFLCGKPFESEEQLEIHLVTHEEKSRIGNFKCNDCNRTYRTRAGYVKHFKMGTCLKRDEFENGEVGDYACNICSAQFSTEAYLKLHKYKVHENPSDTHTCPDCGKKFYSTQGYNKHRSGRPCTEPLKCKICGKTYSSKAKESFKIHMRHHRTEATGVMFECDECDRTYMTQMALNKHKLSHTGVKPYRCDICGKEFAMRYMVKDHARTHTGERPYPCTLCGSTFSNRGHLSRHMRSHENGTLLKRGRPKKVREPVGAPVGLKVIDISSALQHLDRQTIQVVDSQMLDTQVPGAPMIIRADNNTIIITESWPAGGASGTAESPEQQSAGPEITAPASNGPTPASPLSVNS